MYSKFRFGIFSFVLVNPTKISVSVVSVFTRFGRPLPYLHLHPHIHLHIHPHIHTLQSLVLVPENVGSIYFSQDFWTISLML